MQFVCKPHASRLDIKYVEFNYILEVELQTDMESKRELQTCMCILTIAFPINVAPKNVQNGTRKCPHVIPARSNRGLGIWNVSTRAIVKNRALHA